MNLPYVSYHKDFYDGFNNWAQRQLVRWNFSKQVNKLIPTPFSNYVYPRLYPHHFIDFKPICFLFFGNAQQIYQTSYPQYLRESYPKCRIVLYMQDIIARNAELDITNPSKEYDLLISYDKGDAKKYNMEYYPTPMSYVHVAKNDKISKSDLYFCGKGKDRYPLIHSIYEQCTRMGLICDFHITDMPDSAPRINGVHYNTNISYMENSNTFFLMKYRMSMDGNCLSIVFCAPRCIC